MIEQIYWIIEILAVMLCAHYLFSKKFQFSFQTALFLVVNQVYMNLMDKAIVSRKIFFVIYIVFIIYCYFEFETKISHALIEGILSIVMIAIVQMVAYFPCMLIYVVIPNENIIVLFINIVTFLLIYFFSKTSFYKKIYEISTSREWIVWICIIACGIWLLYCMYNLKTSVRIQIDLFIICLTFIVIIACIILKWNHQRYLTSAREQQLEKFRVYNEALDDLIQTSRKNQHDYKNHLAALRGLSLTIKDPEELERLQKEYFSKIEEESRYIKILNYIKEPILAGFIFYKFNLIAEQEIDVQYDVVVDNEKMMIPSYDLNEIVGILLDNAVEAVKSTELGNNIFLGLWQTQERLEICVKNISKKFNNTEMEKFFSKKYTTKGDGRGLGLAKIKDYQRKYKFDIYIEMEKIKEEDWLSIRIIKKK